MPHNSHDGLFKLLEINDHYITIKSKYAKRRRAHLQVINVTCSANATKIALNVVQTQTVLNSASLLHQHIFIIFIRSASQADMVENFPFITCCPYGTTYITMLSEIHLYVVNSSQDISYIFR